MATSGNIKLMEHLMSRKTKCISHSPKLAWAISLSPPPAEDNCQGHLYFLPCTPQYLPPSFQAWLSPQPESQVASHRVPETHRHLNGSLLRKAVWFALSVPWLFLGLTPTSLIFKWQKVALLRQCDFPTTQTALGKAPRLTQKVTVGSSQFSFLSSPAAPFHTPLCFAVPPFLPELSSLETLAVGLPGLPSFPYALRLPFLPSPVGGLVLLLLLQLLQGQLETGQEAEVGDVCTFTSKLYGKRIAFPKLGVKP